MQGYLFKADKVQPDAKSAHEDSAFGTEVDDYIGVYRFIANGNYPEGYCPKSA
jgi:hypothetical protein